MTTFPIHLFLVSKPVEIENVVCAPFEFKTFYSEKDIREFINENITGHSRKISTQFGKITINSLGIVLSEYLKICLEDGWGCLEIIDGSGTRWCEEYEDEDEEEYEDEEEEDEEEEDEEEEEEDEEEEEYYEEKEEYEEKETHRVIEVENQESKYDEEEWEKEDDETVSTDQFDLQEALGRSLRQENDKSTLEVVEESKEEVETRITQPLYKLKTKYKNLHPTYQKMVDDIIEGMKDCGEDRRECDATHTLNLTAARMFLTSLGFQTDLDRADNDRSICYISTYRR